MLHKILLKRFNFLTLRRREYTSGIGYQLESNIFNILVECDLYHSCTFTFPVAFSIKLLDFNNKEDVALLEQGPYKNDIERDEDTLTDIEIQNIFNYFEWLEKYYDAKYEEYCKQHNIPWAWIEKSQTPFVEEVEINW